MCIQQRVPLRSRKATIHHRFARGVNDNGLGAEEHQGATSLRNLWVTLLSVGAWFLIRFTRPDVLVAPFTMRV
jgi:hypothetical protein